MGLEIRRATPGDRAAVVEICLKTAAAGADGTGSYTLPWLPGQLWAAPYLDLEPGLAFVLAEGAEVAGYVVGAGDTRQFEDRLDRDWLPPIRERLDGFVPVTPEDARLVGRIREVERVDPAIAAGHPAHLHINLLPQAQGRGHGRRMIATELAALAAAGAAGVHLGVSLGNGKAAAFYEKLGFRLLAVRHCLYFARSTTPA